MSATTCTSPSTATTPSARRSSVVFTVLEGHITNEELLDHPQRLSADSNVRPEMNHVIDTRGVTDVSDTALAFRLLTTRSNLGPRSRRAIVEGNAISPSGYLRMFETLRSPSCADIRIFSTMEDAHGWLELD